MTKRMVAALLALTAIGAFAEGGPVRRKLIGHSWDLSAMGAKRIAQNVALFDNGALDGVSLNAVVERTVDGKKELYPTSVIMDWPFACTRETMAPHVEDFRTVSRSKTLTDNFLNTFHGPKMRYDWNDEARWNRLKESLRTMAWAAKAGGLRGILMDQEDYSQCRQFFRLPADPPYDELCAIVRQRARELFGAMFGEFPEMTVISFWWLALDSDMMTAGDPRSLMRAKGALWPAFVNGVLDVMPDTARLVEGDEWAYRDRAADGDFLKRAIWHKNLISLVDPANRRKFRANVLSGFGLYLDMYVRGEPVPLKDRKDIRRQYVHASEDGSHLRAFAHNLTQAAEAADEYVWLFACHSQTGTGAFVPWKGTGLGAWDNRPWIEDHLNGFTDICRAVKEPEVWRAERLAKLKAAGKAANVVRPEKRTCNRDLAGKKESDIDVIQVWPVKVGDFYSVEFTVEGEIQPIVRWWDTAYGGRPLTVANVPVVVDGADAAKPRLAHALVRIPEGVTALDLCLRAEPSKVPARYSNVEIVKIFDFSDVRPAVDTLGPLVEANSSAARAVSRPPAEPAVRTITDDGGRYCGWPTVTRLRSGEIVATYSGGRDGHICPWGKVRAVRSKDGGETWTKPETLVDGPLDDRDAALLELDNGDLVLFYFTSVAFALDEGFRKTREYKTHPEYARRFAELPADLVRAELGSFSMRSTDGGRTWERKVRLPASAPHGGIQLRDGRLIVVGNQYAAVRGRLPSDPEERGLGDVLAVAESTDRGRSWRELARIPYGEADRKWTSEPHLVEGLDGTLRCYVRFPGYFWYTQSRDGGRTWTALAKTGIYAKDNPAHLLRLRDGRVLLSFGRRAYTDAERKAGWRIGAYAAVSADDAKPDSWDLDHAVTLLRTENNDMAYPSTVELDDGGFLSVFYYHPDGNANAVLGATRWHLPKE